MPHIHNEAGQIDFTVEVFIVHQGRVLLRRHDKLGFSDPQFEVAQSIQTYARTALARLS